MQSTIEKSLPSSSAFSTNPEVNDAASQASAEMALAVTRAQTMLREQLVHAVQLLGADATVAQTIADAGTLVLQGLNLSLLPAPRDSQGRPAALVIVDTARPLVGDARSVEILQMSAGLLVPFNACLGATDDGNWAIFVVQPLDEYSHSDLADSIFRARRLVDLIWSDATTN